MFGYSFTITPESLQQETAQSFQRASRKVHISLCVWSPKQALINISQTKFYSSLLKNLSSTITCPLIFPEVKMDENFLFQGTISIIGTNHPKCNFYKTSTVMKSGKQIHTITFRFKDEKGSKFYNLETF